MLVPVTCICISIWPPVGAAVLVVIVMSVFFGSIVPAMARSTFWPLAVQVPATSILPPPIAFFVHLDFRQVGVVEQRGEIAHQLYVHLHCALFSLVVHFQIGRAHV